MRLILLAGQAADACVIAAALAVKRGAGRVLQAALVRQDRRDIALATLDPMEQALAIDRMREALREALRTAAYIGAIVAAFGAVGRIDFETERALKAERLARANEAQLVDCMNGRAVWTSTDKRTAVRCRPAEEFSL